MTASERVEECLAGIARHNGRLRAMITVLDDSARAEARATGGSPLAGRIVSVKDNIDTAGVRTTRGSAWFADRVPNSDAGVVARLRRAGALLIGKDNLHEFAFGATSQNPHHGACRNAWNPEAIPGGSSGGAGVSVAAGFSEIAIGTDTGGSVRIPAALNGVAGMRPTIGRISNAGVMPVSAAYDTVGPLARRVVDVAAAYEVLAGYDAADPFSVRRPVESWASVHAGGLEGVRVGVPRSLMRAEADPDVVGLVEAAVQRLVGLGAVAVDIELEGFLDAGQAFMICAQVDSAAVHAERMAEDPGRFGADVARRLRLGAAYSGVAYATARAQGVAWRRQVAALFDGLDLVAMPTVGLTAPLARDTPDMIAATHRLTRLCGPWSFAGCPALSVPCGLSKGMPVGLQIVGPQWSEAAILACGVAYQGVTAHHLARPPLDGVGEAPP